MKTLICFSIFFCIIIVENTLYSKLSFKRRHKIVQNNSCFNWFSTTCVVMHQENRNTTHGAFKVAYGNVRIVGNWTRPTPHRWAAMCKDGWWKRSTVDCRPPTVHLLLVVTSSISSSSRHVKATLAVYWHEPRFHYMVSTRLGYYSWRPFTLQDSTDFQGPGGHSDSACNFDDIVFIVTQLTALRVFDKHAPWVSPCPAPAESFHWPPRTDTSEPLPLTTALFRGLS